MLTETTTRRSAAVLMVSLVAMLLVATGGSARAAQSRTGAGTVQASPEQPAGRQATAVAPAPNDQVVLSFDVASTPPAGPAPTRSSAAVAVDEAIATYVPAATVPPVGRAPPTV